MLTSIESLPPPPDAVCGMFGCSDGTHLRYAAWPATEDKVRGTVCVFPGRAEFIEKYFEVVSDLRGRGFAVVAMDWRGQGLSSRQVKRRKKGHVDRFRDYEEDLDAFMRNLVMPDYPPPYYALAHSMGAHVLLRYARHGANPFNRLMLIAPMIEIEYGRMSRSFVNGLSEMLTLFGLGGLGAVPAGKPMRFENNPLTSDRARFERMRDFEAANPDLRTGVPTIGWVHAATDSIALVRDPEFAGLVRVPVLMLIGSSERIVSISAAEEMGRRLKAGRTLIIAGGLHELLMERDSIRDQVWAAFDAFIPGEEDADSGLMAIA